jgi:chromate transporter
MPASAGAADAVRWSAPAVAAADGPADGCLGWDHTLTQMGWFFTKAALLTFGGAYAVLPYVYQGAVGHYGWLTPTQMIDGLALGETTPGPLIMVVAFVGFVGGYVKAVFGPDSCSWPGRWRPRWSPGSPSCRPSSSSWPAGRWSSRPTAI